MVNPFASLDGFLEFDHHTDGWSDDGVLLATKMVLQLQEPDWLALEQAIPSRKPAWQKRLADCLDEGPMDRAFPILRGLLKSKYEDVAVTAGNSIYSLLMAGNPISLDKEEIDVLKDLSSRSRLHGIVFASIIKKFDPDYDADAWNLFKKGPR